MAKNDFCMPRGCYLLSHSVGRPLKSTLENATEQFFTPWQESAKEPWQQWLPAIENFTGALGRLFNAPSEQFCPQVNLSSGLTKLLMSHPVFNKPQCTVLMAQADFPSMGFVMQKALPACATIRFIPEHEDLSDRQVWQRYLTPEIDGVFVSHVYSNTGVQAPLNDIVALSKVTNTLSIIDVAQSAGVIPVDLTALNADFMIGSSVKWLCGGPGAAYLWVNPKQITQCEPKDVGWFSHQNPFEFDITHFQYNAKTLRFWGGTPSILPYVIAGNSIAYIAQFGVDKVRAHNLALLTLLQQQLTAFLVSPNDKDQCSGTAILDFAEHQQTVLAALEAANISVDVRKLGIRISPHIYNTASEIQAFIATVKKVIKAAD